MDVAALTQFAQRLIRTRSITGHEGEIIGVLATELNALGFDHIGVDQAGSLIGWIAGAHPGPTLLLDGHCDTVDAVAADWNHDPWGGEIVGDRLYGRGAADMKGSLAAMVHAVGAIDRQSLHGRVAVSATVSEEVAEGYALKGVVDALQPDYLVIGEATRLNINRGGRGRAEIRITTLGRSAHTSSPAAGRCAVTDMLRLVQYLAQQPAPVDPFLGPGAMVLTDIISAPYPGHSVIPNQCHVTYDRRLLPGEDPAVLLQGLAHIARSLAIESQVLLAEMAESTYTGYLFQGKKVFPAWIIPADHPLVRMACQGLQAVGLSPQLGAYRFCTNAAYGAGIAAIPTIGFGLGSEEDAHIVDESVAITDLPRAARGYQGIIAAICRP